jgi:hypothetical protein
MADNLKSTCNYGAIQTERTAYAKRNAVSEEQNLRSIAKSKLIDQSKKRRKVTDGQRKKVIRNLVSQLNDVTNMKNRTNELTRLPVDGMSLSNNVDANRNRTKSRNVSAVYKPLVSNDNGKATSYRVEQRNDNSATSGARKPNTSKKIYGDEQDSNADENDPSDEEIDEEGDDICGDNVEKDDDTELDDDEETEDECIELNNDKKKHCRQRLRNENEVSDEHNDLLGTNVTTTVITGASTSSLEDGFHDHCKMIGTMDSETSFGKEVEKQTKKWGWKFFKMLKKEDYNYDSEFAEVILHYINLSSAEEQKNPRIQERDWRRVKKHVADAMQHARSACTQSLKFKFFGKKCFNELLLFHFLK